ncbi:MAG: cation diffusion facilitator family transporter [Gammaproteobacteria bacterium]
MAQVNTTNRTGNGLVRTASYASVAIATFLVVIKLVAYLMTHSVSMLASLIDSLLDVAASFVNMVAIRHALVPADKEHRFGHGKAEPLAGLAQSAFIAGSALFLIVESGDRLFNPRVIEHGTVGLAVMVISTVLTIGLVIYQRYVIKKSRSIAIRADSLHYVGDVLVNLAIIAAFALSLFLDWYIADPLFALGVAAYVLYNAWEIVMVSLDQLMDRELPDEERSRITGIAMSHPDVRNIHELRTRASGYTTFIQMHIEMDPGITLVRAHEISDEVEAELHKAFPISEVIIHEDPLGLEKIT